MALQGISRYWKYFSAGCIIILSTIVVWACGWGGDTSPFSMFAPELSGAYKLRSFYYDNDLFYYPDDNSDYADDYLVADNTNIFSKQNVEEWGAFFKNKVSATDLESILYNYTNGQIDTLIFYNKDAGYKIDAQLKANTINNVEDKAAARAFLFYVGFANRAFKFSPEPYYYWEEERKVPNVKEINAAITGGEKLLANVKYPFIAERYYFQTTRLHFYAGQYTQCIAYYDTIQNKLKENNTIKYRMASYVAGAHYRLKNYGQANYLYAMAFDKCDPLKKSAYISFHPQEEADWNETLTLAKTDEEKSALWFLLGMYADPVRAVAELYKINAKSDYTSATISRIVNIAENDYAGWMDNGYINLLSLDQVGEFKNNLPFREAALPGAEAVNMISAMAENENTASPAFTYMAAGYLCTMVGDYSRAEKHYLRAKANIKNDRLAENQLRSLMLILKLYQAKTITNELESEILPDLLWLANHERIAASRTSVAGSFVKEYLAIRYSLQGDVIKSQCFDYTLNPIAFESDDKAKIMLAFLQKTDKTPYEKYLQSIYAFKEADIYELWGTGELYKGNLQAALIQLEKGNDEKLSSDPFKVRITDCHDCDIRDYYTVEKEMSRLDLVKKMIAFEQEATANPKKAAQNYFDIATAYYSITYYGNNRVASTTVISGYIDSYTSEVEMISGYLSMKNALTYYRKALQASNDKEFKAKCVYMAAKCELNAYYTGEHLEGTETNPKEYKLESDWYETTFIGGTYFEMLKNEYNKTQYYKEVLKECGYFKLYAR